MAAGWAATDPQMVMLGRMLFCDLRLSANGNQSCASCHAPQTGFAGASSEINLGSGIYPGSVPGKIRRPEAAERRVCDAEPGVPLRR